MPDATQEKTGLGNYFVANYPPFSAWKPRPPARRPRRPRPRRRSPARRWASTCTSRSAGSGASSATSASTPTRTPTTSKTYLRRPGQGGRALRAARACVGGRPLEFVYFGGGTPSYLSATQLGSLMTGCKRSCPGTGPREVTFECEPGTLQQHKLATLKQLGVTRLSLGVENFETRSSQYQRPGALEDGDLPGATTGPATSASTRSTST